MTRQALNADAPDMPNSPSRASLRQRIFARILASMDGLSFELYGARKTALLGPLRGTVLELGPGTGVNLRYFDPGVRWIGLEPNRALHPYLHEKARGLGRQVEVLATTLAEAGIAPGSVDAVVSTLVLCSVPSVPELLREVLVALRPGGSFVFLEHVADRPRTLRRLLQRAAPLTPWRYFSGGCDPARDLEAAIRGAGFSSVRCEAYLQEGPGPIIALVRPHICGVAVK